MARRLREPPPFSMFSTMVHGLIDHAGEEQFQRLAGDFHALRHDETAQMERILADPYLNNVWKPMVYKMDKDDEFASSLRIAGNRAYHALRFEDARRLYNSSVLFATHPHPEYPSRGEVLAMSYFNRSCASISLGDFESALEDIRRSEEAGYPESKIYRITDRKARALAKLKRYREAREVYEAGLRHLNSDEAANLIGSDVRSCFSEDWMERLNALNKLSVHKLYESRGWPGAGSIPSRKKDWDLQTLIRDQKPFAQVDLDLSLSFDPAKGRHFVAERDFAPGELLVIERPFASVLDPDCWETHCGRCYRRTKLIVPCPNCCLVSFCSEECRDVANQLFHKVECPYIGSLMDNMLNSEKGDAALANRIVVLAGLQTLEKVLPKVLTQDHQKLAQAFPDAATLRNMPYSALFNLQSHTDKLKPDEMLRMGLQAYYLSRLLQEHGFLNDNADNDGGEATDSLSAKDLVRAGG